MDDQRTWGVPYPTGSSSTRCTCGKLRRRRDTPAERSGRSANVGISLVQLQNVVHAEKPGRRGGRSYDATDDQTTSREYIASVRAVRGNDTFRADSHSVGVSSYYVSAETTLKHLYEGEMNRNMSGMCRCSW